MRFGLLQYFFNFSIPQSKLKSNLQMNLVFNRLNSIDSAKYVTYESFWIEANLRITPSKGGITKPCILYRIHEKSRDQIFSLNDFRFYWNKCKIFVEFIQICPSTIFCLERSLGTKFTSNEQSQLNNWVKQGRSLCALKRFQI